MYTNHKRLLILDADGTTIDAYSAIERTFLQHGMTLGDEDRFQKRHRLFKYLGGLREFPTNLKHQLGKQSRKELISTLTEVYRTEAKLYPGVASLIKTLLGAPDLVVGLVTRNISNEPIETLRHLFARHGIDIDEFAFLAHIPLKDDHERLTNKFDVPEELISRTPHALCKRVLHGLGIQDGCLSGLRVMVLSVSAGAGHVRAAQALRAEAEAIGLSADHLDVMDFVPRWFRFATPACTPP